MNFIESFKKGQEGGNKGIPLTEGLEGLSKAINGVQKGRIYGIGAAPKAGKSTLCDVAFVIQPSLYCLDNNIEIEIIYNSYELPRVSKEFDFAAHFLNRDYGIEQIALDEGVTKLGKNVVDLSSDYLMGRLIDDTGESIKVKDIITEKLKEVYINRIIPLFGEYDKFGNQISKGIIIFNEERNNPTGIRNELMKYAKLNGTMHYTEFVTKDNVKGRRISGYTPKNPSKFVIVITDHLRKIIPERGFNMKQTVDKAIEYSVEQRNMFNFSFVHIIHLNRNMTDMTRIKYAGDLLYPNSDDIKDSGNLAEEADYMLTMFNPNDERYRLTKHFGKIIKDGKGNEKYPNMRTIHLVENRHGPFPVHFGCQMLGNVKQFKKIDL